MVRIRLALLVLSILCFGGSVSGAEGTKEQASGATIITRENIIQRLDRSPSERGLVQVQDNRGRLNLRDIEFDLGSDQLSEDSRAQLKELGLALNSPNLLDYRFRIAGHTDGSGEAGRNKQLSLNRAKKVKSFLVRHMKVKAGRLQVEGWGAERPLVPSNPYHSKNRRVEIINMGK